MSVVPWEFTQVLDGSDTADYVERVEPSEQGGRKMAEHFVGLIAQVAQRRQEAGALDDDAVLGVPMSGAGAALGGRGLSHRNPAPGTAAGRASPAHDAVSGQSIPESLRT